MSSWSRKARSATRLISRQGQLCAVKRTFLLSGGGPSSLTPGVTSSVQYPCRGALFPINLEDLPGTTVRSGVWRFLMSVDPPQDAGNWDPGDDETGSISDITVKPTDQIICSAGVLSILETGAMDPGGVTLFYDMRLVLS